MLYLITGLPGASKTLNTIKTLCEDLRFQNRPIYYHNIKHLALDWQELTKEQAINWHELPDNAVIVLDECQDIFPPRKVGAEVPESVAQLSTHRHRGYDIFLITQHPMLLDTAVRRLVGNHFHYVRQYGMKRVKVYEWQKCANDPEDYHAKQEAEKKSAKLDKAYFDKYKSAEVHTHKPRISRKLVFTLGLLFLAVSGIIYFVSSIGDKAQEFQPLEQELLQPAGVMVKREDRALPADPLEYAKLYEPRIEGLDYTAPIYDHLTEPKSFPKPSCIINEVQGTCRCYSQQATRLEVPHKVCRAIVKNGWFDFTREDKPAEVARDPFQARVAALPQPERRTGLLAVVGESDSRSLDYDSRVSQVLRERAERRGR